MLYLDPSALVRRYEAEEGSDELVAAMAEAAGWGICRIGCVETVRAVGLAAGKAAVDDFSPIGPPSRWSRWSLSWLSGRAS